MCVCVCVVCGKNNGWSGVDRLKYSGTSVSRTIIIILDGFPRLVWFASSATGSDVSM